MTKQRVLIGTPLKGNPTTAYALGLADSLRLTDAEYIPSICPATYVQAGRNTLVAEARKHGCDEIIFIDSDIGFHAGHLQRLRSHDVDIVGGIYPKRVPGEPQWTAHATGEPLVGDLQPVNDLAGGFLRIKMSVFDRFDVFFPEKRYQHDGEEPRTEYFTVGLTEKDGCQHPAEALCRRIRAILVAFEAKGHREVPLGQMQAVMAEKLPLPEIVGEDVGFIRCCRAMGVRAYVDTKLVLRHYGEIGFPAQITHL